MHRSNPVTGNTLSISDVCNANFFAARDIRNFVFQYYIVVILFSNIAWDIYQNLFDILEITPLFSCK